MIPKDISEQQRIVAKLDALSLETKTLETIYRQKLANLDELKNRFCTRRLTGIYDVETRFIASPFPAIDRKIRHDELDAMRYGDAMNQMR